MECGILDFDILKSGIQLKESGIPLTIIRVRHSRSTDNESEIQHLGSGGLHNVESRILICGALTICMENKFRGEFKWNGSYLSRYYLLLVLTFYPFFPFSVPKKIPVPFDGNFSPKFPYKYMVSAHGLLGDAKQLRGLLIR